MKKTLVIILLSTVLLIGTVFVFREWLSRGEVVSHKNVILQEYGEIKITIESPVNSISVEMEDERDLFMALGFSQALVSGDRIEFLRLCAKGELSDYFGRDYEAFDVYMKSWKFLEMAGKTLDSLNIGTHGNILAFAQGINQRYKLYDLPSGCLWHGIDPEEWTPDDIVAIWHMLRWSQMENWPLYFLIRYLDIYYGKHVKEQFDTALGMKIHELINVGHVRKTIELYDYERHFRQITGLSPILEEHITAPMLIYGYSGAQNEDWLSIDAVFSEKKRSYVMHAGLPLFFAVNGDGVYPAAMRSVSLGPPGKRGDYEKDIIPTTIDMYGNSRYFDFSIKMKLFDLNGEVFKALMNKDSVVNFDEGKFSYGKRGSENRGKGRAAYIQSDKETEINKEISKNLRDTGIIPHLSEDLDPLMLSLFRVRLIDRIYRDDLAVIHPVFADWPAEFPSIFLRHFHMIMKNPYSAWWDKRETPDITENMFDIIREVLNEVKPLFDSASDQNIKPLIRAIEYPGHPLSRFHLFTGKWQYYTKEPKAPLLIKKNQDYYYYDRFYFTP